MRPYEVMVVYDPGLEESAVQEQVDRSTELIRSQGGTPGKVDRWGRRRLAYEIGHHREGYYVVIEASAEPATMDVLDRSLYLADEVLRHKVIRIPDKIAKGAPRSSSAGRPSSADIAADEASTQTSVTANGA